MLGRQDLESEALLSLAGIYTSRREDERAEPLIELALGLADSSGSLTTRAHAFMQSGELHAWRRRYEEALADYAKARDLFAEVGAATHLARTMLRTAVIVGRRTFDEAISSPARGSGSPSRGGRGTLFGSSAARDPADQAGRPRPRRTPAGVETVCRRTSFPGVDKEVPRDHPRSTGRTRGEVPAGEVSEILDAASTRVRRSLKARFSPRGGEASTR